MQISLEDSTFNENKSQHYNIFDMHLTAVRFESY